MDILIDYLCFTSKIHAVNEMMDLLKLGDIEFMDGNPRHGWTKCYYFGGIRFFDGGRDDIMVEMSGAGCRFLESIHNNNFDWLDFFDLIMKSGNKMNVSRLDVACDEKEGILSIEKMVKHIKQGRYISKARCKRWIDGNEQCIILGAPTSDTRLRIYNKAMERGVDGHWIRAEFQLRNEAADSFLLNLRHVRDIGNTYCGVLCNYLRFIKQKVKDLNEEYDKAIICSWWNKFLQGAGKIKNIRVGGLEYNLTNLCNYLQDQVSSSIKAWSIIHDGDISIIWEMIEKARLSKKQQILINTLKNIGE